MKLNVEAWMTKHPFKVDSSVSIHTAAGIMTQECISHLLVIDSKQLVGVISQQDLELAEHIKKKFRLENGQTRIVVRDLMSRNPVTIEPEKSMKEAIQFMKERHIHSLPVVSKNGESVGIITQSDVLRFALVASQSLEKDL